MNNCALVNTLCQKFQISSRRKRPMGFKPIYFENQTQNKRTVINIQSRFSIYKSKLDFCLYWYSSSETFYLIVQLNVSDAIAAMLELLQRYLVIHLPEYRDYLWEALYPSKQDVQDVVAAKQEVLKGIWERVSGDFLARSVSVESRSRLKCCIGFKRMTFAVTVKSAPSPIARKGWKKNLRLRWDSNPWSFTQWRSSHIQRV